ncbi:MAG: hypothetical protein QM831_40050 [Kofleriaceae bacterium]
MRVVVFDNVDRLSILWRNGVRLYRRLGHIDAFLGVSNWSEAFAWLQSLDRIDELQYWGHGKWGLAYAGDDVWDASTKVELPLGPDPLIWFRTCETFGAHAGHAFARSLADQTGARVAGHTHIIGVNQSGLHGLMPGATPDWSVDEGLLEGTPEAPERARRSAPWRTHTITFMTPRVPEAWFSREYRATARA